MLHGPRHRTWHRTRCPRTTTPRYRRPSPRPRRCPHHRTRTLLQSHRRHPHRRHGRRHQRRHRKLQHPTNKSYLGLTQVAVAQASRLRSSLLPRWAPARLLLRLPLRRHRRHRCINGRRISKIPLRNRLQIRIKFIHKRHPRRDIDPNNIFI